MHFVSVCGPAVEKTSPLCLKISVAGHCFDDSTKTWCKSAEEEKLTSGLAHFLLKVLHIRIYLKWHVNAS